MKLKWTEDKSEDFRANHGAWCFRLDVSRRLFFWPGYMTYKSFKIMTRAFAHDMGAGHVMVFPEPSLTMKEFLDNPDAVIVLRYLDERNALVCKFRKEIPVNEGETRRYHYFSFGEVFGDQPLVVPDDALRRPPAPKP